jgi:hypothetical protein
MTTPSDDPLTRLSNGASRGSGFSPQEALALRKELLIMRAELERKQIVHAVSEVRERFHGLRWLRLLTPSSALSQSLVGTVLTRINPLAGSVFSVVAGMLGTSRSRQSVQRITKFAAFGLVSLEIVKRLRRRRREKRAK